MLWKYSGFYMVATGVIHNLVGVLLGWDIMLSLFRDGLINTIQTEYDRNFLFWFLSTGFFWIVMGHVAQGFINRFRQPLPPILGWYLLGYAVAGCLIMPASGIWLFLPQGWIIIASSRRQRS